MLQQYNDILPDAAERILRMAEAQSSHRQDLERRVVKSDILKSYLGIGAGFLTALVAIGCGSWVAYQGQPGAGVAIGGLPVVGLVLAFLKGTSARQEEREIKSQQMQKRQ